MDNKILGRVILGSAILLACGNVLAGTGGAGGVQGATTSTEFDDLWNMLVGWSSGSLGKIISLAAVIIGIAAGLLRQSVSAAVIGISMAVIFQWGPSIIDSVITSTAVDAQTAQVLQVSNGMTPVDTSVIDVK